MFGYILSKIVFQTNKLPKNILASLWVCSYLLGTDYEGEILTNNWHQLKGPMIQPVCFLFGEYHKTSHIKLWATHKGPTRSASLDKSMCWLEGSSWVYGWTAWQFVLLFFQLCFKMGLVCLTKVLDLYIMFQPKNKDDLSTRFT